MRTLTSCFVVLLALTIASPDVATQTTASYGITDLGRFVIPYTVDRTGFPNIAGEFTTSSGEQHAWLGNPHPAAGVRDLGTLGGSASWANGVTWDENTSDYVVVGGSETSSGSTRAFIYRGGVMSELPATLGGEYSNAFDVNADG